MSKKIKLTQGQYTIVDDDVYKLVKHHKWHAQYSKNNKSYYAVRVICSIYDTQIYKLLLSRYIMDLDRGDKRVIDHINHDTLDNRRSNLRICTNRENLQNQKRKKLGLCSSKYVGVCWSKSKKKWCSRIKLNNKRIHLGLFSTELEASKIYQKACKEIKETCILDINNYNIKTKDKCSSKYKGVSWHKQHKKWQVRISINKKQIHLGYFKTEEEAYKLVIEYSKKK